MNIGRYLGILSILGPLHSSQKPNNSSEVALASFLKSIFKAFQGPNMSLVLRVPYCPAQLFPHPSTNGSIPGLTSDVAAGETVTWVFNGVVRRRTFRACVGAI